MAKAEEKPDGDPYRSIMRTSIAAIMKQSGFTEAEPLAMESLLEMALSYMNSISRSAKHNCELANRAQVMVSDVSLALIDAGTSIDALKTFADKQLRKPSIIQPPQRATEPSKPRALSTNRSTSKPPYIHDNLPSFPDKHSYIQTPAQRHPTTDYQLVREKAANQKKHAETALTKFIAKTGASNSYTRDADHPLNSMFPLIACKPSALCYLSSLLPKDEDTYEVFDLKDEQELSKEPKPKRVKISDTVTVAPEVRLKAEEGSPVVD